MMTENGGRELQKEEIYANQKKENKKKSDSNIYVQ